MEWTGLNDLRKKYLSFFESKGHLVLKSFSLIPNNDNSLLLINSGMAPMKKYFTGEITPPRKRVTTCQKCIRTPDIERVGITARHGTYFEMLGNFSFGDYFKHEATAWAWEFCTKELKLPVDKLWVSIYQDDNETFDIWTKEIGVDPSHIVRLGKEDNFWEHGMGPCGPCSEIYFDRGEKYGCGKPDCKVGCDCDRYVEFWNLVFTQFENDGNNNYSKLESPNIDTGMGLERLACIMQGVDNLFLVDTVKNILDHVCKITGVTYGENDKEDVSIRVITDHIRSTTFMIADGVMPSNEGRGYVLRRLLRRASRHGRILGLKEPFLAKVCETVIKENESAYPELREKENLIKTLISMEEASFERTIDQGLQILTSLIDNKDIRKLSGEDAFKLNDTYGFPIDLTKEIVLEKGITVDEERFKELLLEQKERARSARKKADKEAWLSDCVDLGNLVSTEFVGYNTLETKARVLAIIKEGNKVDYATAGDKVVIILDKTPFYAESGGQVGDSGEITTSAASLEVVNTEKNNSRIFLHESFINEGVISCEDEVVAKVNVERRKDIARNHTGAHLLQAALRKLLGLHVEQAGQLVNENQLRFDFTHFAALTDTQLKEIENLVNEEILSAVDVKVNEMNIEDAKKLGAMALFGEKYGDRVRVVDVSGFSIELCGGTHVDNTSKLGLFKIISESSVASGVRRIEAVTGNGVLGLIESSNSLLNESSRILKINGSGELIKKCESLVQDLKDKDKKIEEINNKLADMYLEKISLDSKETDGICFIVKNLIKGENKVDASNLKTICTKSKERSPNAVTVLVGKSEGKVNIAVSVGKELCAKGLSAGKIIKEIASLAGGNGGGKADIAMAGIKDESKIEDALKKVENIVANML